MLRELFTAFGIIEFLIPEALITKAEQLGLENPEECESRSWAVPAARVEGLLLVLLMQRRDSSYSTGKKILGLIGILSLLYPRAYIDTAVKLAYTDASSCDWQPWVYRGTRLTGLFYVIIAINELRKDERSS